MEPRKYLERYLVSYLQQTTFLSVTKGNITKASQLENPFRSPVFLSEQDRTIFIGTKTGKSCIPISQIEEITRDDLNTSARTLTYFVLHLKGERDPLAFYSPDSTCLDLWYDGIRMFLGLPPETATSLSKILNIFVKAAEQAKKAPLAHPDLDIPPPPEMTELPPVRHL